MTELIFMMQNEAFFETIREFEPWRKPISSSKSVLVALLAGWLLVGGLHTTAYASELPEKDARILGYWQRGEGEAIIEVTRQGDGYHGVIVASERRPEIVGTEVFRGLSYDAEEEMFNGRAFSIKRQREVRIDIKMPSSDELKLTAHVLIFTKRVQFKRIPGAEFAARRAKSGL